MMTSPTPLGSQDPLPMSTPGRRPLKLTAGSPRRVPAGVRAWRRGPKSRSSAGSSGKGLGMGMTSTPAKSKSKLSGIGWQSTPVTQRPPRATASSEIGASSDTDRYFLDTFSEGDLQLPESYIQGSSDDQHFPASQGEEFYDEHAALQVTVFPSPQDFLIPLNDLSDYVNPQYATPTSPKHPWEEQIDADNAADDFWEDEDQSVELGRAAERERDVWSDDSSVDEPWLASPLPIDQVASPTPTFPSPMRYSPPAFSATATPSGSEIGHPASSQCGHEGIPPSHGGYFSAQVTIKPRRHKQVLVWRGRSFFTRMRHLRSHSGSRHSIDETESEASRSHPHRRATRTQHPSQQEQDDPERSRAYEIARKQRIAHYIDLERNYKFAEEWVMW